MILIRFLLGIPDLSGLRAAPTADLRAAPQRGGGRAPRGRAGATGGGTA